MAHDELTPGEAALIEEYEALLADPSLWADVPAELEERVVDAITAEAAGATIFLVPAANCADAKALASTVRLVQVATLGDAVSALEALKDPARQAGVKGCA